MNSALEELQLRGLIAQSTNREDLERELAGCVTFYCGFDPTAPSLHLGNLAQILTARRLQLAGHRPLALVGGATGLIGDPKQSGERRLNDADAVREWADRIGGQLGRFLDFEGPAAARLVDNYEWISRLSAIELLRDVGKHFSVNLMLDREAVAVRLAGAGISYTEFSYQVLQAFDFLELRRRFDCRLQTGGSDQWGNIVAGVDLIRRVDGVRVHGLTTHLITKADGTKFGKTESGTVWLDRALTTPYAFFQFWINADDRDVPKLLSTFSMLSVAEMDELVRESAAAPHARLGQRRLAGELTAMVHGESEAMAVEAASQALFGGRELRELDVSTLTDALSETRVVEVDGGCPLPTVAELVVATGLVDSRSAARRLVAEGGLYVNNERVGDEARRPSVEEALVGGWLVLRRGRKSVAGVRVRR